MGDARVPRQGGAARQGGEVVEEIDVAIAATNAAPINPSPQGLGIGADGGTVWFTGKETGTFGRATPDGKVEHFALKTVGSAPIFIKAGPYGAM